MEVIARFIVIQAHVFMERATMKELAFVIPVPVLDIGEARTATCAHLDITHPHALCTVTVMTVSMVPAIRMGCAFATRIHPMATGVVLHAIVAMLTTTAMIANFTAALTTAFMEYAPKLVAPVSPIASTDIGLAVSATCVLLDTMVDLALSSVDPATVCMVRVM